SRRQQTRSSVTARLPEPPLWDSHSVLSTERLLQKAEKRCLELSNHSSRHLCSAFCNRLSEVGSRLRSDTATVTGSHAGPPHHTHHHSRSSTSWVRSSKSLPASRR